jgi:hypothetical protein
MSGTGRDQYESHAFGIPFDPDNDPNCDLTKENVQEAIEELCSNTTAGSSPGYSFGREGIANANTWLIGAETLSNKRGLPFGLNNGSIKKVTVSTQNIPGIFTVEIYYHDGNLSGSTLVGSVTTTAVASTEDFVVNFAVPKGHQLACLVSAVGAPKPKEVGVFLVVKGDLN